MSKLDFYKNTIQHLQKRQELLLKLELTLQEMKELAVYRTEHGLSEDEVLHLQQSFQSLQTKAEQLQNELDKHVQ
ncbi:hypothetical protein [Mangrovibacillus cuniculi]|uniref:Uncharacterized protein n=1 Tax=Mangrovibacillus cuniculi TaxID=2593652 RepID=A0A7S8CCL6_9BACI|nr:hypothetical protein [Mangrovibacillus cuniculi]QPC47506.1 hypothetical protein G8O30_11385 [Mangrovibacillus cuniculi]